jgi:hypothetical protein
VGQSRLAIGVIVAVVMVVLLGPWSLEIRKNDGMTAMDFYSRRGWWWW